MTREREDFFEHLRKPQKPKGGFSARNAVKALKESVANVGHRTGLPPKLLELFQARPELEPGADLKKKKPKQPYTGIADYVAKFAAPGDPEYDPPPPSNRPPEPRLCRNPELPLQARLDTETKAEKKIRLTQWKKEEALAQVEANAKQWNPSKDSRIQGDPYKTLFVSRISFDVNDKKLRREFEEFGPITSVKIVHDTSGKSRGYAFVEYEHKQDMKEAYKQADGRKIEGRRVVVDVERGRTVEGWRPRRLAGGLGGQGREPRLPKKAGGPSGLPGPSDDRPFRSGPPGGDIGGFRGPPPRDDFRGGPPRSGPDTYRPRERSPPRGGPPGGLDRERDRGADRDRERERGDRDRERDRGGDDRDRKREREASPRRPRREDDGKRFRPEDDRRDSGRRRERDML